MPHYYVEMTKSLGATTNNHEEYQLAVDLENVILKSKEWLVRIQVKKLDWLICYYYLHYQPIEDKATNHKWIIPDHTW